MTGIRTGMVTGAKHIYSHPGPWMAGVGVGNVLGTIAGAGPVVAVFDVGLLGVVTAPAWVGAATLVGTVRHGVRKVHALRAEIAGKEVGDQWRHVRQTVKGWQVDELRATRKQWAQMVKSDEKFPAGTRVTKVENTPQGRVLHVSRPGQAAADLHKWREKIAGWFAAGTAEVRVLRGAGGNASRCHILLTETDPFKLLPEKSVWRGYHYAAERGIGGYSVLDPMPVGIAADGTPYSLSIRPGRSHRVIGTPGSGKGNYVLQELLWCLLARDAWVYCVDFEGGEDFARLAPFMRGYWSRITNDTPPEVVAAIERTGGTPDHVLSLLTADANARAGLNGAKQVTISDDCPLLHLLIDGYHRLTAAQWDRVHEVIAELRKYGVHVTLLDQVGTKKHVTTRPDTLSLCSGRIVFDCAGDPSAYGGATGLYLTKETEGNATLPRGRAMVVGFGTDRNDPGVMVQTGWAGDGAHDNRDPYTKWSKAIPSRKWSTQVINTPPKLTTLTGQTASPPPPTPSRTAPLPPVVNYTPAERSRGLWAMLVAAGGREVRQAHLIASSGATRNTVKARLRQMAEDGAAEVRADGQEVWWRARTVGEG